MLPNIWFSMPPPIPGVVQQQVDRPVCVPGSQSINLRMISNVQRFDCNILVFLCQRIQFFSPCRVASGCNDYCTPLGILPGKLQAQPAIGASYKDNGTFADRFADLVLFAQFDRRRNVSTRHGLADAESCRR